MTSSTLCWSNPISRFITHHSHSPLNSRIIDILSSSRKSQWRWFYGRLKGQLASLFLGMKRWGFGFIWSSPVWFGLVHSDLALGSGHVALTLLSPETSVSLPLRGFVSTLWTTLCLSNYPLCTSYPVPCAFLSSDLFVCSIAQYIVKMLDDSFA